MPTFQSILELKTWLESKGIDTTRWGRDGAKTVENLWAELVEGESQLQDDPPQRQVRVVNVMIRAGQRLLVEGKQEFGANQSRYRGQPPAEKLKPGESPVEAAIRCLQEEMEINPKRVQILSWTEEPEQIWLDSPSYPGLTTRYTRYEVEARVENLPRRPFRTTETAHDDGDPVKYHQWLWADL
ncbi:MAG: NUDIX domain-containing protein [Anaerolineae bacterium]|nr:NUDIX domain-containing protein [Anaerolineae bacterium]